MLESGDELEAALEEEGLGDGGAMGWATMAGQKLSYARGLLHAVMISVSSIQSCDGNKHLMLVPEKSIQCRQKNDSGGIETPHLGTTACLPPQVASLPASMWTKKIVITSFYAKPQPRFQLIQAQIHVERTIWCSNHS